MVETMTNLDKLRVLATAQIPNFSRYAACSKGRIWRIARPLSTRYKNRPLPYEIAQFLGNQGYWTANLDDDQGKRRKVKTHRLITMAFHGPPPEKSSVAAHLDGNRRNNRADNLAWATQRENMFHRIAHGTARRWIMQSEATMTNLEKLQLLGNALHGPRWQNAVARDLGINPRQVHRWVSGEYEPHEGHILDLIEVAKLKQRDISEALSEAERCQA